MTPIKRARIASELAAKAQELSAVPKGPAQALARVKLAREVVALIDQLGGGTAVPNADSPALKTLAQITEGLRDRDELSLLFEDIRDAAKALQNSDSMAGAAEELAHKAITRWAQIEEKTDV